jgi:hypothetical protein
MGGVASAAGITVLLLLLPSTLGAVGASSTLTAPYKTAKVALSNPVSVSGCAVPHIVSKAFFNKTTGIGGFSANATTSWCTNATNNSALATGQLTVSLPIHVRTTGTHKISVFWVTVATGSVNLTAGTCAGSTLIAYTSCTRSAKAFVYGTAFLVDQVTLKKVGSSNIWPGNFVYVSNYTSCYHTTCTSTASAHSSASFSTGSSFWAWYWNKTLLNASHNYTLKMTVFGGSQVILKVTGATLTGASANAQLNSATRGNDEQLYSISIS